MDSPLWVDKYRPTRLEKLTLHPELNRRLKKMVESGDLPHLLFYGPSGAGKKTRIIALLRELYGATAEKVKVDQRTFSFEEPKVSIEMTILSSMNHVELTPSDAGIRDYLIVQSVVKEFASSTHINDSSQKRGYKIIVLNEVDRLSKRAQHALRRTMETSTAGCRLILSTTSSGKVISPLRSRCLQLRVPLPKQEEISTILESVAKREGINLPAFMAEKIIDASQRNLRRALLMFEATKVQNYPFSENQLVQLPEWELFVKQLAQQIIQEQTPQVLRNVREYLYELLSHCIPADIILRSLCCELYSLIQPSEAPVLLHLASQYDHRIRIGSKDIFHLEAFVANFMCAHLRSISQRR